MIAKSLGQPPWAERGPGRIAITSRNFFANLVQVLLHSSVASAPQYLGPPESPNTEQHRNENELKRHLEQHVLIHQPQTLLNSQLKFIT